MTSALSRISEGVQSVAPQRDCLQCAHVRDLRQSANVGNFGRVWRRWSLVHRLKWSSPRLVGFSVTRPSHASAVRIRRSASLTHTLNTFITSSPKWLMTFTAIRPVAGRANGRDVGAVEGRPGFLVDLGLQRGLEALVGVVRAEEIGVADEEALLVVVGVDEPGGDALGVVGADVAGVGIEDVDAVDLHADRPSLACSMSMSGSPKTTKRLPLPVFFSSSAMCRSGFIRAFRIGSGPSLASSEAWASKLKAQAISTSKRASVGLARGGDEVGARDRAEFRADEDRGAALGRRLRMKRPSAPIYSPGHGVSALKSILSRLSV